MTLEQQEELKRLIDEVNDTEKQLEQAKEELKEAQDWLEHKKVYYAEAIIELDNFKKENNLK